MVRMGWWVSWVSCGVALLSGCGRPEQTPDLSAANLERVRVEHPIPHGAPMVTTELGRTREASFHLVQIARREPPHTHERHDLTVFVQRGNGRLYLDGQVSALAPGDAVFIPRGKVHYVINDGPGTMVGVGIFTPPYSDDRVRAEVPEGSP